MKRIGLTGSIGAGKSAAVEWLRGVGVAVHDADAAVHEIYQWPEMTVWLAFHFPDAMKTGELDRQKLASLIYGDAAQKQKLESFIHPAVSTHRTAFIAAAKTRGEKMVVCDIPLLFETGLQKQFHEVWLVAAPDALRLERVMQRHGMTPEKFWQIDKAQISQDKKRRMATHVIDNGGTLPELYDQLSCLIGKT